MNLLKNIKLVMDINKFYKNLYEGHYTKVRVKDLNCRAWLLEIQYDINEMLDDYADFKKECGAVIRFLESINRRLIQRSEQ